MATDSRRWARGSVWLQDRMRRERTQMAELRIATFNLENCDETAPGGRPSLAERIALMRPQIVRLRADIACFQEVHGQERPGQPRALLALSELLAGTNLEGANVVSTKPQDNAVYDVRNIVVATHLPVSAVAAAAQRSGRRAVLPAADRRSLRTPPRSRSGSSGRSCTSARCSA